MGFNYTWVYVPAAASLNACSLPGLDVTKTHHGDSEDARRCDTRFLPRLLELGPDLHQ